MTRTAIISDVHGNLEALTAVLKDINADRIFCPGDIVGYGTDSKDCVKLVRENCKVILKGNHEYAIVEKKALELYQEFRHEAARSLLWTREKLGLPRGFSIFNSKGKKLLKFFKKLDEFHVVDDALFVHGSPRDPVAEYFGAGVVAALNPESELLPENMRRLYKDNRPQYVVDSSNAENKLNENFDLIDRLCFNGHTHNPCAIIQLAGTQRIVQNGPAVKLADDQEICVDEAQGKYACVLPETVHNRLYLGNIGKAVINVGCVGQPRYIDKTRKATYVTYDDIEDVVEWHRVSYDVEKAASKVEAAGFPHLANRLRKGM